MVDQHAESARRSGFEIGEERLDVIEAVESFDDDTFDPKIVAPHPFKELCIMDAFHDDARRASGSGSGTGNGHRTRRGSGCRRGVRWRPPQGDRRAVDDERAGLEREVPDESRVSGNRNLVGPNGLHRARESTATMRHAHPDVGIDDWVHGRQPLSRANRAREDAAWVLPRLHDCECSDASASPIATATDPDGIAAIFVSLR